MTRKACTELSRTGAVDDFDQGKSRAAIPLCGIEPAQWPHLPQPRAPQRSHALVAGQRGRCADPSHAPRSGRWMHTPKSIRTCCRCLSTTMTRRGWCIASWMRKAALPTRTTSTPFRGSWWARCFRRALRRPRSSSTTVTSGNWRGTPCIWDKPGKNASIRSIVHPKTTANSLNSCASGSANWEISLFASWRDYSRNNAMASIRRNVSWR